MTLKDAASLPKDLAAPLAIDEMQSPSVYPHPVAYLRRRETHISWIILTGQYAYKIKKAVRLEFIDSTALSTRRFLCEQEVALNRRLAPDLYLGVVAITRDAGVVRIGGCGEIIEYAVKMQEFQESQELSSLLDHREVESSELIALAQRLAEFHQSAPQATGTAAYSLTEHLRNAVLGNLASLLAHLHILDALPELGRLIDWTHDTLHELLPQLRSRERLGFIRECHGDLHARNIVRWHGALVPFDCLDFAPELRWIDVMNDVAFLVMDLASHDRADLVYAFLDRYLAVSGDYDGLRLLPFYAIYRALVRAMVDSIAAETAPPPAADLHDRLRNRVATAAGFMNRPPATLYLMHGPSGSGKSWVSERLAASLPAVRIRSDVERKRLAGLAPLAPADAPTQQGAYSPEATARTYARLLECARGALEGGIDIIVDAAFLDATHRRSFDDLATALHVRCLIISCEAARPTLIRRVQARQTARSDASDAGLEVLEWQLAHWQPLCSSEQRRTVRVSTDSPDAMAEALASIRVVADIA